jgi:hypothetical protein
MAYLSIAIVLSAVAIAALSAVNTRPARAHDPASVWEDSAATADSSGCSPALPRAPAASD